MLVSLHPHFVGLYHSTQTLSQLGIAEQLDSGIYLLYQKKNKKSKYFNIVSHCESPTHAAKTKCSDLIHTKLRHTL